MRFLGSKFTQNALAAGAPSRFQGGRFAAGEREGREKREEGEGEGKREGREGKRGGRGRREGGKGGGGVCVIGVGGDRRPCGYM